MSANLRAFLALLRWCEGTSGPDGYRTMVGGRLFDSFADHPRQLHSGTFSNGTHWRSTAAGAYQFLTATWDRAKAALGLPDFGPESQDKAAIWLIEQRGALADIEAGDLREALRKCSPEWASLPFAPYGQPTKSYEACAVVFERAGGTISQPAGTLPQAPPSVSTPVPAPAAPITEKIMAAPAIVLAAAQALLPIIADLFRARGSATSTRNAQIVDAVGDAAPAIVAIAKEVAGGNEQQAAEKILADPELQKQFRAQVALQWSDIEPFLRFEEESRSKAREFMLEATSTGPEWRQVGVGVLLALLSLIIVVGGGTIMYWLLVDHATAPEQRGMLIGSLVSIVVSVVGYWFGSSASSRSSGQALQDIAKR